MKVLFSPYSLIKKMKVNVYDQSPTHLGALIKIIDPEMNWGVADLSPWPTLGDSNIKDEIRENGELYQRAIELAKEDLYARKEKKSLLQNKWVENNIIVTDYLNFNFKDPKYRNKTLKIKGNRNIGLFVDILNSIPCELNLRIDFNACLSKDEFQLFLKNISTSLKIEYIEDPMFYDPEMWQVANQKIPLAADFVNAKDHYQFKIVKPSREKIKSEKEIIITSAMDHPVGVAHALRYAQMHAKKISGLMTLDLFETTKFYSYFIYRNDAEMNFSENALNDFGIGMTEDLLKLNWVEAL